MTLNLYHGSSSVCSSKVRIGLAEKGLDWHSNPVNLKTGEQNNLDYLKLNPKGVVPTLLDDGFIVTESSVILEYIDGLSDQNVLMPSAEPQKTQARMWLARCIDIHAAINTMTFSTVQRAQILSKKTPEEIEKSIARMANPATATKRREVLRDGLDSPHVWAAFFTLMQMFDDMQKALVSSKWLIGDDYSIADTSLLSYVDRLERLGFEGLWATRTPKVSEWLLASKQRASYAEIENYIDPADAQKTRAEGQALWPEVELRWMAFLDERSS